jgi:pentatricopeptide repeat protein
MQADGFEPDVACFNALISHAARQGDAHTAIEILNEVPRTPELV